MIFKIKKVNPPYTQIHNNIIDNPELSGKAKWVLIYLLSKPQDWQVYEKDIVNHCTDGKHSIRSGIHELINAGYINRKKHRNELGQFRGYEYEVYEIPMISTKSTEDRFSDLGKPAPSNTNLTKDGNIIIPDWELLKDKREYLADRFREIDDQMIEKDAQETVSQ